MCEKPRSEKLHLLKPFSLFACLSECKVGAAFIRKAFSGDSEECCDLMFIYVSLNILTINVSMI